MGKIIYLLTTVFLFGITSLWANSDTTIHLKYHQSIKGNFSNFSIDNLGNIYTITENNQIKKFNSNLDSIAIYNDSKRFGNIYSIDATNPFKLLLYYKDYATIVMLDKQLNYKNSIALREHNIQQASAISLGYDNQIWVFDEVENKLKKLDENGNQLFETVDFRLLFNEHFTPQSIIDADGTLFLYHSNAGWKLFDYYGAFKKQYPLLDWQDVQVLNYQLTGHDTTKFFYQATKNFGYNELASNIPIVATKKIIQTAHFFYLLTNNSIEIYKLL